MSEHESYMPSFDNPPDPRLDNGWDDADTINEHIFCPNPELGIFELCELRDEVENNPEENINDCLTQIDHDAIRQSQKEKSNAIFSSEEYIEDINQCFLDKEERDGSNVEDLLLNLD